MANDMQDGMMDDMAAYQAYKGNNGINNAPQNQPYIPSNSNNYMYNGFDKPTPVDPNQMQAAAFLHQSAVYAPSGGFGFPQSAVPPAYGAGAGIGNYHSNITSLPGPSYYDPYGMINPAVCVNQMNPRDGGKYVKKKEKRCFGCC